jgi:hypothetical protein
VADGSSHSIQIDEISVLNVYKRIKGLAFAGLFFYLPNECIGSSQKH